MFSFFVFCVICSWVGWWRNGIVEKIQEKLPENGDFMAFLHWLFPNFNVCKMFKFLINMICFLIHLQGIERD